MNEPMRIPVTKNPNRDIVKRWTRIEIFSTNAGGREEWDGNLRSALKHARQMIKQGDKVSVYQDIFETEEPLDPVGGCAYFTDEETGKLRKSKY